MRADYIKSNTTSILINQTQDISRDAWVFMLSIWMYLLFE